MSTNDMTLDLSDKNVSDAFAGNRVGDECELENVRLKVKRLSMSHDDEYGKDGKPTGKKKANGTITFEIQGFDYGDHSYDFGDGKEKTDKGGEMPMMGATAPAAPGGGGKSKAGLVVAIGLGKPKSK